MPPWWKIRRELVRPFWQALQLPELLFVKTFSTAFYDLFLSKKKKVTYGAQTIRDRVAIFAIYSPKGITNHHQDSLTYIKECGYATVLVSNCPVSELQKAELRDFYSVLIERPNYGYDFGAYREGVLHISTNWSKINFLVFLNDSCIFPLSREEGFNWFLRAERSMAAFYAVSENNSLNKRKRVYGPRHFHYASYAFMAKHELIIDPNFYNFWLKLRLSFSKNFIVREGEIRLSNVIMESQHSHDCQLKADNVREDLLKLIGEMSATEIANVILSGPDENIFRKINKNLIDKRERLAEIEKLIYGQGLTYHLSLLTIPKFKVNFLKKKVIKEIEIKNKLARKNLLKIDGYINPYG